MSETKQARAVTVIRGPSPGPLIVRVDGRGKRVYYLVRERERDPGPPEARVFAVARLGAATAYNVRCAPAVSCECVGWYAHSKCIHTGMLDALLKTSRV